MCGELKVYLHPSAGGQKKQNKQMKKLPGSLLSFLLAIKNAAVGCWINAVTSGYQKRRWRAVVVAYGGQSKTPLLDDRRHYFLYKTPLLGVSLQGGIFAASPKTYLVDAFRPNVVFRLFFDVRSDVLTIVIVPLYVYSRFFHGTVYLGRGLMF